MAGSESRDDDFTAFVLDRSARLVHFARMLCGDAGLAEEMASLHGVFSGSTFR